MPEHPTLGVVFEEGPPGFGIVRLTGLQDAPAGEAITIGRAGVSNHSPSISSQNSSGGQVSRISIAWIEAPAGDISGVGAVMLQRLDMGAVGNAVDLAALAAAANDNAVWLTDLSGTGAIGCEPSVAELSSSDAVVVWIGADGHARGRFLPPMDADSAPDGGAHAALNAALDDLGPVATAPDGSRRLQVTELRSGIFAIMWTALAESGSVLRGSLFLSHAGTDHDDHRGGWTQLAIPELHLPLGFAGPLSMSLAEEDDAGLAVTVSGLGGTIALKVLDHNRADVAGNGQAADSAGLSSANGSGGDGRAHARPAEEAEVGFDGLSGASQPLALGGENGGQPWQLALTIAATPGVSETAPLVQTLRNGFAVAWQTPGEIDTVRQIKLVLYDAKGVPKGPEILVADDAAVGADAVMCAFGDGVVAAYVDADDGTLVVKTYAGDGARIGQANVVVAGDGGAISGIALASSGEDEFAVAYVQHNSAGVGGGVDYGNVMLQRYSAAPLDGAATLIELGRDGERDGTDVAVQLATQGDDPSVSELAIGRAPAAIGVGDGGLAIAWVEWDGARETVQGVILDRYGAEVLRIDLSGLLGEAGIANGAKPVLLDVGPGSFLVSWLQPDADGGCTLMAATYCETAPGLWMAPEQAVRLERFDSEPKDYAVFVSTDADGSFINVIWSEDGDGPGGRDAIFSQRYDLEGRRLGDAMEVAEGNAATGGLPHQGETLAAAGLPNGQVVIHAQQGSGGDHDLFASIMAAESGEDERGGGTSDASEVGGSFTFTTRVDEETAINPLAGALGSGLSISHINNVPITTASPVDVGTGWVQLREDGWLTVTPDAGHTGQIAFDFSVTGAANRSHSKGHAVVNVEMNSVPAAVTLLNQVTAVPEAVSTASALKVADIAMADAELGTDGLSLTGLDAGMFAIVGNALYLKEGIELDFETKPTLSVEILASHANEPDGGASFTLSVAGPDGVAPAFAAASDAFVFAPGYGEMTGNHPLIDLSSTRYTTFRELMDSGALSEDGGSVVITLNPEDPADLQKVILKGVSLSALSDTDFKFS